MEVRESQGIFLELAAGNPDQVYAWAQMFMFFLLLCICARKNMFFNAVSSKKSVHQKMAFK